MYLVRLKNFKFESNFWILLKFSICIWNIKCPQSKNLADHETYPTNNIWFTDRGLNIIYINFINFLINKIYLFVVKSTYLVYLNNDIVG